MIHSLAILLTDRCNLACRHCSVEASPRGRRLLPWALVRKIAREGREAGLRRIGISGGEPLVVRPLLFRALRELHDAGLECCLATNGFWALGTKGHALALALAEHGVVELQLSLDEYHEEHLNPERVLDAARYAREAGMRCSVRVTASSTAGAVRYRALLKNAGDVEVHVTALEVAGRAARIRASDSCDVDYRIFGCENVTQPAVLLDGDVVSCCDLLVAPSHKPRGPSPLWLGNLMESPLREIVDRAKESAVHRLLRRFGPDGLWELAETGLRGCAAQKPAEGCQLCWWLFGDPERARVALTAVACAGTAVPCRQSRTGSDEPLAERLSAGPPGVHLLTGR
jgi:MoaA/NifB/PqqE/SkfB family radical SAM enzyme